MSTGSLEPARQEASQGRILVVDDDGEMRALLAEVLREAGYDVKEAANGAEALIRLRAESFAAIVLDKNMPGLTGLDLLPGMRVICPETPVVLITAFGDVATYVDACPWPWRKAPSPTSSSRFGWRSCCRPSGKRWRPPGTTSRHPSHPEEPDESRGGVSPVLRLRPVGHLDPAAANGANLLL